MRTRELPQGLKYEIEKGNPGTIVPGSDRGPVVTIAVQGGTIQYRLISYILHRADTPTWEGDIEQKKLDEVESWVNANLPMLLAEAQLHRIIRFDKKAKCYYDFRSQTLYEANGYYEKKGSTAGGLKNAAAINGKPILLPGKAIPFIEILTRYPGVGYGFESFIDDEVDDIERAKNSLSQAFYKFLRYDSSIRDTFIRETTGSKLYKYVGEPQKWVVGEKIKNETLTIKMVYDTVAQSEILSICDPGSGVLIDSVLATDIKPEEAIAFLGIDTGLFNLELTDSKRFFDTNYLKSADALKSLLSRYCTMLDAVWAQIARSIKNNFLHSLSASTYFRDTRGVPHNQSDYLRAYPLNMDRLGIVLKQIYPSITKIIKDFGFEEEFFKNCNLEIESEEGIIDIERVIDGIVSLLLLCLCCCQTAYVDEALDRLKKRYHDVLLALIQKKFDYIPPSNSGDSLFDPEALQIGLQDLLALRGQLLSEGQYAKASVIEKFFDGLNLSYNDENSLLPPSRGREL